MPLRLVCTVLLAFFLAAGALAAGPEAKTFEHQFKTRVSVDEAGQVTGVELVEQVSPVLAKMVGQVAAGIPFAPATRDGVPVASRTALLLRLRFSPEGEGYRAELVSVFGGAPAAVKMHPPRYPDSLLKARQNLLAVIVVRTLADGSTDVANTRFERLEFYSGDERVQKVSGRLERETRAALLEAVSRWSYILEEVGGVAITTELRVPVTMCAARRGAGVDTAEACRAWLQAVAAEDPRRAEPVEPGLQLAQPRIDAAPPAP